MTVPKHLDPQGVRGILQRWVAGEKIAELAREFGLTPQAVHQSIHRNKACKLTHNWTPMPFMCLATICARCGEFRSRNVAKTCSLVPSDARRVELASIFNVALRNAERRMGCELPYAFSANKG